MFIDAHDLRIETNDQGFIIGESLIGDVFSDDASGWREVRTDFSALTIKRSTSVEKGVLFRPEASVLTLRTPVLDYMNGVFGKSIRVFWKDQLLFQGTIRSTNLTSDAEHERVKSMMTITAVDAVDFANKFMLFNYSAPSQTAGDRAIDATAGTGIGMVVNNCIRPLASRPESSLKMMTVLQEASDAQLARFYSDRSGRLVMDGNRPGEPTIVFSDDESAPGHVCYRSVSMSMSENNSISGVVVQAKQDETMSVYKQHPSALFTHEEKYEVDLPLAIENFTAWADSFPLMGYTTLEPSGIDTYWQDALIDLELSELVRIQWQGNSYRCGVSGITYDIKPTRDNGLTWNVDIDLIPGHVIEFTNLVAPSPVQNFVATALDPHDVQLTWRFPAMPASMTGYMLRYNDGAQAPVTPNDGFLIGTFDKNQTSFTLTNQPSRDQNSYAIWAITANANVYSGVVTATATTPEVMPTAYKNLAVTKNRGTYQTGYYTQLWHTLTWQAPDVVGDTAEFWMFSSLDGSTPGPTNASNYDAIKFSTAQTQISRYWSYYETNKTVKFAIYPKTLNGVWGPGSNVVTSDTNEVTPPNPTVSLQNISMPGYSPREIRVNWSKIDETSPDFFVYRLEYTVNRAAATVPGQGTLIGEFDRASAAQNGYHYDTWVDINADIRVTVFTKTYNGKFGLGTAFIHTPA